MKRILSLFKWKKAKKLSRASKEGRRVTGVASGRGDTLKILYSGIALLFVLVLCVWGGWQLFKWHYRSPDGLFILHNPHENLVINSGKSLTPDLVREVLELHEGVNLFSLNINLKRNELMEQAPNIKDLSIVRCMPDKMVINIIERDPVARVGGNGRVVDEEGVVFIRYAGIGALPMIKPGEGTGDQLKPGDRLFGNDMAAVNMVMLAQNHEFTQRLLAVDASKRDFLLLTFADYRQAKFAWRGMGDAEKHSKTSLKNQYKQLGQAMDSEIGRPRLMWDATQPGRIFAMSL